MKLFILPIIPLLFVCFMGCSLSNSQTGKKVLGNQTMKKFQKKLSTLKTESNSISRQQIAQEIATETQQINKTFTSEDINTCIKELATFLNDNDDLVCYWIARALGNFGTKAKIIKPNLIEVLKKKQPIYKYYCSKSSVSGIEWALKMIDTPVRSKNSSRSTK